MTRWHPVLAYTRWFAWYRVPVAKDRTAWLCWVERSIAWNDAIAFWGYRLPGGPVEPPVPPPAPPAA